MAVNGAQHEFIVHNNPVWRDRANFIIHAELPKTDHPKRFEQLWARHLGDDRFELCCIPFFVFDLALGDVVTASPKGSQKYVVRTIAEPSKHYAFRIWFGDSFQPRDEIADELQTAGSLIEWSSSNLLAVDAINEEHAQLVANFLIAHEKAGNLIYETGRS